MTGRYTPYPGGPSAEGGGAAPLWRQRPGAEEVPVSATLGRRPRLRIRRSGPWRPRCLGKGLRRWGGRGGVLEPAGRKRARQAALDVEGPRGLEAAASVSRGGRDFAREAGSPGLVW